MAYDMNAEGVNGVQQTTYIVNNVGGGGWILPPPTPPGLNGDVGLFVSVSQPVSDPPNLAALQGIGAGKGPGVLGQTGQQSGVASGVGVAGFSLISSDSLSTLGLTTTQTAGVFGQCDGGPGVKGQGGAAANPPNPLTASSGSPVLAGFGVIGIGGDAAAASIQTFPGLPETIFPPLPAGAGVVGMAGGASAPNADSAGVVGVGSPSVAGFYPGVGVIGLGGSILSQGEGFANSGVLGQGGDARLQRSSDRDIDAGPGVLGTGGKAVFEKMKLGDQSVTNQIATAAPGVVGLAGNAGMPALPNPPASTPGVVGIGSPAQTEVSFLPGGAGVLGLGAGVPFPVGTVVTNGPGVVGIGAPFQPNVGAGRGGVFGSAANAAQIQLVPSLVPQPLPDFGQFGDLYLTLIGTTAVMFLCVRENTPALPGPVALWAPFMLGSPQNGGASPSYP